jgi:hypothetical protein
VSLGRKGLTAARNADGQEGNTSSDTSRVALAISHWQRIATSGFVAADYGFAIDNE